jgi:hypothetical protein
VSPQLIFFVLPHVHLVKPRIYNRDISLQGGLLDINLFLYMKFNYEQLALQFFNFTITVIKVIKSMQEYLILFIFLVCNKNTLTRSAQYIILQVKKFNWYYSVHALILWELEIATG